jgi:glycosyltransferase involved in cell wall biosynthesis
MDCAETGLSVIIPLLAPDDEFMRAVHSVRSALTDRVDFELIVVTRSSHVASVRELVPWCKVVAESRRGIYGAMNDGMKVASGKYLYFMGKDDILLPSMSRLAGSVLESMPVAAFAAVYWGDRGIYAPVINRYRIFIKNTCHQGALYSRQVLLRHGGYVRRFKYQADHYLNIKLLWGATDAGEVVSYDFPVAWYSGSGESEQVADKNFGKYLPSMLDRYVGVGSGRLLLVFRLVKNWFRK